MWANRREANRAWWGSWHRNCMEECTEIVQSPYKLKRPLPWWQALALELQLVFLLRKPLRCLMLPPRQELVRKETSAQVADCKETSHLSPGEMVKAWQVMGRSWRSVASGGQVAGNQFKGCRVLEESKWRYISVFRTMLLWWTLERMRHLGPWWPTKTGLQHYNKKQIWCFNSCRHPQTRHSQGETSNTQWIWQKEAVSTGRECISVESHWGAHLPACQGVICCLLGAKVWAAAERGTQLVKSADYFPLLLLHVGANDTTSQNLGRDKEDLQSPGGADEKCWCLGYLFFHFTYQKKG